MNRMSFYHSATAAAMLLCSTFIGSVQAQQPEMIEAIKRSAAQQGLKITDEEARRLALKQLELQARFQALGQAAQSMDCNTVRPMQGQSITNTPVQLDEKALLAKVIQLRGPATPIDMSAPETLDLTIKGRRYLDPEGLLANVTVDSNNGDATFFVGRGKSRAVKFLSGHSPAQALTIGQIEITQNGFEFSSLTGVHILGQKLITLPDGIALWRDDALFLYQFGQGSKSYALPAGFYPADLQRGNIWKTGLILLRRNFRFDSNNEKGLRATKQLFGMLAGRKKSEDFALYDFQKDKMLMMPLQDSGQGEDGALLSSARTPNLNHYFWNIQWLNLGVRRFAVYFRNGVRQVVATDIDSGKTAVAMSRDLGINGFEIQPDGKQSARLVANWMFKDHDIPDLVSWFDAAPAEPQ